LPPKYAGLFRALPKRQWLSFIPYLFRKTLKIFSKRKFLQKKTGPRPSDGLSINAGLPFYVSINSLIRLSLYSVPSLPSPTAHRLRLFSRYMAIRSAKIHLHTIHVHITGTHRRRIGRQPGATAVSGKENIQPYKLCLQIFGDQAQGSLQIPQLLSLIFKCLIDLGQLPYSFLNSAGAQSARMMEGGFMTESLSSPLTTITHLNLKWYSHSAEMWMKQIHSM